MIDSCLWLQVTSPVQDVSTHVWDILTDPVSVDKKFIYPWNILLYFRFNENLKLI